MIAWFNASWQVIPIYSAALLIAIGAVSALRVRRLESDRKAATFAS